MKIEVQRQDVSASGIIAQREFTVKVGAHLMKILSGIYTNPVGAMVREYLTNMYDAYIALREIEPTAEIIPAELTVPSILDSTLVFRDYGVGMSLDTVWEVYSQYGNSTKNASNTQVGGFGIGSKVAFCYNGGSNWMIESRHQGMLHSFIAYINEESVPSLTHVSSVPTTEHSGVTIRIPIQRNDVEEVQNAVKLYAPYFPMPLTVRGPVEVTPLSYTFRGKSWGVRTGRGKERVLGMVVVMGNVPYPLPHDYCLANKIAGLNTWERRSFFEYNDVDFFVPIGAVDIVPSRDALQFTDKTKAALATMVAAMVEEIPAAVERELTGAGTEWEALERVAALTHVPNLREFIGLLTWRGKKLDIVKGITVPLADFKKRDRHFEATTLTIGQNGDGRVTATPTVNEEPESLRMNVPEVVYQNVSSRKEAKNTTFLVIDNVGKGGMGVARGLVAAQLVSRNKNTGRAYKYGCTPGVVALVTTKLSAVELADMFKGMPVERVLFVKDLLKTVPIVKAPVTESIYRYSTGRWAARARKPGDPTAQYYYVVLSQSPASGRWGWQGDNNAAALMMGIARTAGIIPDDTILYGVKPEDVSDLESNWVNIVSLLEQRVKEVISNSPEIAFYQSHYPNGTNALPETPVGTYVRDMIATLGSTEIPAELKQYDDLYRHIETLFTDSVTERTLLEAGRRWMPSFHKIFDRAARRRYPTLTQLDEKMRVKYPLLSVVFRGDFYRYSGQRLSLEQYNVVLDYLNRSK